MVGMVASVYATSTLVEVSERDDKRGEGRLRSAQGVAKFLRSNSAKVESEAADRVMEFWRGAAAP